MVGRRQFEMGETFRENKREAILEKGYVNPDARAKLEKDYVQLSDSPESAALDFVNKMAEHDRRKSITPEQEIMRDSYKNPQKAKRRMNYYGRQ